MTVSFGLGLSATIHFLNRLAEDRPDQDAGIGVARATVLMGPPLIFNHGGAGVRLGGDGAVGFAFA